MCDDDVLLVDSDDLDLGEMVLSLLGSDQVPLVDDGQLRGDFTRFSPMEMLEDADPATDRVRKGATDSRGDPGTRCESLDKTKS